MKCSAGPLYNCPAGNETFLAVYQGAGHSLALFKSVRPTYNCHMQKKLSYITIAVDEASVPKRNSWHVLLYEKEGDFYYITTVEDLFKTYLKKQKDMESEMFNFEERIRLAMNEGTNTMDRFRQEMTNKFNDLLLNYKNLSEKLIAMVDKEEN